MKVIFDHAISENLSRKNISLLLLGVILVIPLIFILDTPLGVKGLLLLFGILVGLVSVYSFYVSYFVLMVLLFTPSVAAYHTAVFYTFFVALSFFVNFKWNFSKEVLLPVYSPFLFYCLTTIPSLINTPNLVLSLLGAYHLIAFFILSFTTLMVFNSHKRILNVIYGFVAGVVLHSLIVIPLGLTSSKRVFGLLDVFYVDFAGLGGIISFILFIYLKGLNKVLAGLSFVIITFGLILTQTRNAWISFTFAFVTFVGYLLLKGPELNVKRHSIIVSSIATIMFLGGIFIFTSNLTSDITQRFDVKAQTNQIVDQDPNSIVENSFVTRLFIWHTAVSAFIEHPIIGIGAYSFPFSSKQYYKIPRPFYEVYVQNRTSHVTFLSVLTETGITGFVGFMFFLYANLKLLIKNIKIMTYKYDIMRTLIISWVFVYMFISMTMTDAWLFGQQILIWGIFLGLLVSNYRLLSPKRDVLNAHR